MEDDTRLSLSSSHFLSYSCESPVQVFSDPLNDIGWHYRDGGPRDSEEAIMIFPSLSETTNTMYLVASALIDEGYRVIVTSIPPYDDIHNLISGFDRFAAKMRVCDIHLIGVGFGGFLSLHLASLQTLSASVKSMVLVGSYANTRMFSKGFGLFHLSSGKRRLSSELAVDRVPHNLRPSVRFVLSGLRDMCRGAVKARMKMRATAPPPHTLHMPDNSVLVVQSLDWSLPLPDDAVPQAVLTGQKVALLKSGGCFPHLAAPDKLTDYIVRHLAKWRVTDA